MRHIATIFAFLCLLMPARAAVLTNLTYDFADFTGRPLNVKRVTITPLAYGADYEGAQLSARPIVFTPTLYPDMTNGTLNVTNLVAGYAYRVEFADSYTTTTITNYFPSTLTGAVDAGDYKGVILSQTGGVTFQFAYYQGSESSTNHGTMALTNGVTFMAYLTNIFTTQAQLTTASNVLWAEIESAAGGGISSATATNIAAYQAYLATNGFSSGNPNAITNNYDGDVRIVGSVASGTNYTDRVENTNTSSLKLVGGSVELTLESGAAKVNAPYYFQGQGDGLTNIRLAGVDGLPAALDWLTNNAGGSGISQATASAMMADGTNTFAGNGLGVTNVGGYKLYSVKTYGAAGDGTTDDSAAIQSAATVASATSLAAIGELFFPVGTYLLDSAGILLNGAYGIDVPGTALDSGYWKISGQTAKIVSQVNTNAIRFVNGMRASVVQDLVLVGTNVNKSPLGNHVGFAFDGSGGQVRIQDAIAGQFTAGFVLDDMTAFEGKNLMAVSNFVGMGIGFKADGVNVNVRASGNKYGVFLHYTNSQFSQYTADGQPSVGGVIGQNDVGIMIPFGYAHITKSYFENNVVAVQLGLSTNAYELSYPRLGTLPNVTVTEAYGTAQAFAIWTNSTLRFENSGPLLASKVYLFNTSADASTVESDVSLTVVKSDASEITIGNGYRYVNGARVPISGMSQTNLTDLTIGDYYSGTNVTYNTNWLIITGCDTNALNGNWYWNVASQVYTNASNAGYAMTGAGVPVLGLGTMALSGPGGDVFSAQVIAASAIATAGWLNEGSFENDADMATRFALVMQTPEQVYANLALATNLPVTGISASGTPSGTTYLSGDGAWSIPAGGTTYTNNSGYAGRIVGSGIGTNVYASLTNGFTGTGAIVLSNSPTLYNAALTGSNYMENLTVGDFYPGLTNAVVMAGADGATTNLTIGSGLSLTGTTLSATGESFYGPVHTNDMSIPAVFKANGVTTTISSNSITTGNSTNSGNIQTATLNATGSLTANTLTSAGNVTSGSANYFHILNRTVIGASAFGSVHFANSSTTGFTNLTLGLENAAYPRFNMPGNGTLNILAGNSTPLTNLNSSALNNNFTNGLAMATNYVAANFIPTPGMAKLVFSNSTAYIVTQISTNALAFVP